MQAHVIKAVVKRELASYFSSPTGYVFITIFIFLSAFAAFWLPAFFTRNLANLDQLNQYFPALLVFLIPAITMNSWAEERKQGTDELLLTLPARDLDIVLGKYLACLGIYTVALLFSLSHWLVLSYLGRPDTGVMISTYAGHWLAGVGLIAVAMIGSALTSNLTVAFIASASLCALVVGVGALETLVPRGWMSELAASVSFTSRFDEFGRGVVVFANVAYFLIMALIGLGVNVFLVGRRHWAGSSAAPARTGLALVRLAAYVIAGAAAVTLLTRTSVRADTTSERLWSLSTETRKIIDQIDESRPVLVTAYVSKDVPRSFVQQRATLLGLLKEIGSIDGGKKVAVRIIETEKFSDQAREAKRDFGIEAQTPQPAPEDIDQSAREFYMGIVFQSGPDQFVIPFLSRGLSVEYELARSIRTVGLGGRKKIGIVETDAELFGQFDFRSNTPARDWEVVDELRKQHEVVRVPRGAMVPDDVNVLIVAQPSSLRSAELTPVLDYVRAGRPAIIMEDPFPVANPYIGTLEPRGMNNPFGSQNPRDREPKADLRPLYELLGVEMPADKLVWDSYNPRPQFAGIEPEYVFVGRGNKAKEAFNSKDPITSSLQEMLLAFTGEVKRSSTAPSTLTFEPLITGSPVSGVVDYRDALQRGQGGMLQGFNPNRKHVRQGTGAVLAARVRGVPSRATAPAGGTTPTDSGKPVDVVLVPDLDFVSQVFFQLRNEGVKDLEFDNVTFILNAVDELVGDSSLLEIRNRRREHRTLTKLDASRLREEEQARAASDQATAAAQDELEKAKARLTSKVEEIQKREDLDENTRLTMVQQVRMTEQRRVDVQAVAIEDAKQQKIEDARADASRDIEKIQLNIRTAAVLLPPIPALVLACGVFVSRRRGENLGVDRQRLR